MLNYVRQCFDDPISIGNQLESYCRNFWWGKGLDNKGIPWISWKELCKFESHGGMSFIDFKYFNMALITKQLWCVIQNLDSLVARVFKAKYFKKTDVMEAKIGYQPS